MAYIKPSNFILLLLLLLFSAAYLVQGSKAQLILPPSHHHHHQSFFASSSVLHFQGRSEAKLLKKRNSRRLMIGSTAPTCTYNECKGCKYKCRAEQVPVEGNDPINSAYRYKCVCHR